VICVAALGLLGTNVMGTLTTIAGAL